MHASDWRAARRPRKETRVFQRLFSGQAENPIRMRTLPPGPTSAPARANTGERVPAGRKGFCSRAVGFRARRPGFGVPSCCAARSPSGGELGCSRSRRRRFGPGAAPRLTGPSVAPLLEPVTPAIAHHRHDYPVPPGHDTVPHDASVRHLDTRLDAATPRTAPAPAVAAPASTSPRFVLSVSPVAAGPGSLRAAALLGGGRGGRSGSKRAPRNRGR